MSVLEIFSGMCALKISDQMTLQFPSNKETHVSHFWDQVS